jgi:signal peptidase I
MRGGLGDRPPRRARTAMRTRHPRKLLASCLGVIALACLWFSFAPVALGGSTTYVVTDGVSMQPRFHAGDLVLVRGQSDYRVGQIVAYHSKVFHTIVFHRIIARDGNRYVFKGDNNNFTDFEHPARSQLIGALWMHIPGAGARLKSLSSPALIAILMMTSTLLLAGGVFVRRRRRRHRQRRATGTTSQSPSQRLGHGFTEPLAGVLAIGLLALLPFVALALLSFTRAPSQLRPLTILYKQSGRLSYTASATPGPTYAENRAVTGDTLFTHVIKTVALRFEYRFHVAARHSLSGKGSLDATITSTSGWQTALKLDRSTSFHGDRAVLNATLDVPSLLALVHRVEESTAVHGSYTLSLVPHVNLSGSVAGRPLHVTYTPHIQFALSPLELQPLSSGGGLLSSSKTSASPFAPSTAGSLASSSYQPLFLSLKLARPTVTAARWIALGGIASVLLVLLAIVAFMSPRVRVREEASTIRSRYGRMIVPVERVWQLPGVAVIDVADMAALARIAERYDRSILHESTETGEAFWVTDESGQFRYAIGAAPAAAVEQTFVPETIEPAAYEEPAAYGEPIVVPETVEPVAVAEPPVEELPFDPLTHEAADAIVREWRAGWDSADITQAPIGPA